MRDIIVQPEGDNYDAHYVVLTECGTEGKEHP